MDKPAVLKVTQTTVPLPGGTFGLGYAIQFTVGPHGPFTLQIAAADFTAEKVQAQLEAFAATLNALPKAAA